jgi:branched-subunit amino acid aminotransferase/4-amino-4-deoxychorismate lyase
MQLDGVSAEAEQLSALALTNYGHFTSMRVESLCVRGLSLHMDRLRTDSRTLFDLDLDPDRVRALVRRALAGDTAATVVRVTVFDPELDFGRPGDHAHPRILITTRPATPGPETPPTPMKLRSVPYCRELPEVKHVGLFPALYHRGQAQRAGFDDALFVGPDGAVSEVATSNIGVIRGERVIWPAAPCLPGVTMRLIDRMRGSHETARLTLADFADADAAFATNAAVGIRPIARIDESRWSPEPHPTLRAIREQYAAITPEPL